MESAPEFRRAEGAAVGRTHHQSFQFHHSADDAELRRLCGDQGCGGATDSFACRRAGARGITVNVESPGPTETDLFLEGKTAEQLQKFAQMSSFGRISRPPEIADVVAFLASNDGRLGERPEYPRQRRDLLNWLRVEGLRDGRQTAEDG